MAETGFSNEFGSVHSDRISFYAKKSWFGGGVLEDLPIRHVTSVRFEMTRNVLWGVVLGVVGLALLSSGSGGGILVGLILLAAGVLMLIGWPAVTINTAGNDLRRATGTFLQKEAAEAFTSAVKQALFAKP
jgi:hypothetical protein